jgi:predicted RNase H-like HicB family nuclease
MAKTIQDYTVVIRTDNNGTFVDYIPAIPGCHAWGRTLDDARLELNSVFDLIAEEYQEADRSLPPDVELIVARAS